MNRLTLGKETLALSLNRPEGAEAGDGFTVTGMDWKKAEGQEQIDTLILTAADSEDGKQNTWSVNGEVFRKMNKSGIEHLRPDRRDGNGRLPGRMELRRDEEPRDSEPAV